MLFFIDIETTHLKIEKGEIIDFALIVDTPKKKKKHVVNYRIKPKHIHTASKRALEINGYTERAWSGARSMDHAAHDIHFTLRGTGIIFVGHNIKFDLEHINYLLQKRGYDTIGRKTICTKSLALEHLPFLNSHSLKSLRSFFGISTEGAHTALKDALDCRDIYYRLIRASAFQRMLWRYNWRIRKWIKKHFQDG